MANSTIKGISILLGADASQLTTALHDVDASLKNTQAQLKEVNTALKFNPENVELLGQKMTLLSREVEQNQAYIDGLKNALQELKNRGIDPASDEYMALQRAIIQAESKQESFKNQLNGTESALNNTKKEVENYEGSLTSLKVAMGNLISQGIQALGNAITNNIGNAVSRVDTLNNYAKTMENLGYSAKEATQAQTELADSLEGLPTALNDIIGAQQQYVALFGDMSKATDLTIALNDATLAGGQGTEAATRAMDAWYKTIAKGKPEQEQWQTLNETMPAQMNQIAETMLGAGAKSQDLFKAWQNGTVTTDEVVAAITKLDQEGGKGFTSFADQALSATGGINTAWENMKIAVTKSLAGVIDEIGSENIAGAIEKITDAIYNVGKAAENATAFVKEHKDQLIVLGTMVGSVVAGLVAYNTAQAIKTALDIAEVASLGALISAQLASAAATLAAAAPYIIIAAAITALIAIIVLCVKHWDEIKAKVKEVADNVKQSISNMVENVKEKFNNLKTAVIKKVADLVSGIKQKFKNVVEAGKALVTGIWQGITDKFSWLVEKIKSFANNVTEKLKSFFGIHSPSKVMREQIGKNIALGIAEGITDETNAVVNSVRDLANATLEAATVSFEENTFSEALKGSTEGLQQSIDDYTTNSISTITKLINNQVKTASKNLDSTGKKEMSKAGKSMIASYTDAIKEYASTAKELLASTLDDLSKEFETKYNELVQKQQTLENKLKDYGDLFTTDESGKMIIADINAQTSAITDYFNKLVAIKGVVNEELFDAISKLSIDQGTEFVEQLLAMAPDELEAYNKAYLEKIKLSEEMSKNLFANDLAKLKDDYTDAIDRTLGDVSEQMNEIGVDAMQGFINGMESQRSSLMAVAQSIADSVIATIQAALDINSPSKVMEKFIGANVVKGLAKGITENSYLVEDAMASLVPSNTPTLATISDEMINAVGTGMALANSGNGTTKATVVVNLGGAKVAEQIFKLNKQGALALQG